MALVKLLHTRKKETDSMFAKIHFSLSSDGKKCTANFSLGQDLAQLIDGKIIPEKINVFYDSENTYLIVIKKSEDEKNSFKLRKTKSVYQFSFTWKFDYPIEKEKRKTKKIKFDMHPEGGIQLELNKEFVPYPGG